MNLSRAFFSFSDMSSRSSQFLTHWLRELVPMPCPLVPTKATNDRNPSGVNHWNQTKNTLVFNQKFLPRHAEFEGNSYNAEPHLNFNKNFTHLN